MRRTLRLLTWTTTETATSLSRWRTGVNRLSLNDGTARLTYVPGAFGDVVHDGEHVRAADFDRDGNMDVVFVAESDEVHQLFLGDGKGRFKDASERLPASSQGNALAVGDVNDDGLPDILIGRTGKLTIPWTRRLFLRGPCCS